MKVNSLINALARGYFLIDPRYAERYLPFIADIFNGTTISFYTEAEIEANIQAHAGFVVAKPTGNLQSFSLESEFPSNSLYMAKLSGPVMKENNCGVPGTAQLMSDFREALYHPNISGIIFETDTGGGAVDGTFEFADDMIELQQETDKPIFGFVNGLSCSAGYVLMASCEEIWTSHKTAEVGSIGVCTSFQTHAERLKAMGVQEHYIAARTSQHKNLEYLEARAGKYDLLTDKLDALHAIFQDHVKANRPGVASSALTGKVYLSEEALSLKLIDNIGSKDQLINHVYSLINSNT